MLLISGHASGYIKTITDEKIEILGAMVSIESGKVEVIDTVFEE